MVDLVVVLVIRVEIDSLLRVNILAWIAGP